MQDLKTRLKSIERKIKCIQCNSDDSDGGGIIEERDPIFVSSPSYQLLEEDIKNIKVNFQQSIDEKLQKTQINLQEFDDLERFPYFYVTNEENETRRISFVHTLSPLQQRLNDVADRRQVWNPTSRLLETRDGQGNLFSSVSLVSLDNEGTDLRYNSRNKSLDLFNGDNELLDSIPITSFVGNVGTMLGTNGIKIQLKDSQGSVLSETPLEISNINSLQNALNSKENILVAGTIPQYYRGDKTWQTLNKAAVGLFNVDNTSDMLKPISTATLGALTTKLDKTSVNITAPDAIHKYIYLTTEDNIKPKRMLATDLGKNMSNAALITTKMGSVTQGATYTWETLEFPLYIKTLPNKANDRNFNNFLVQDSAGQVAKSNGMLTITQAFAAATQGERDNFMLSLNSDISVGTPSVNAVLPAITQNLNEMQYLVVEGINLNLHPTNRLVALVSVATGQQYNCPNIQTQTDGRQIVIEYNLSTIPLGDYRIKIINGAVMNNVASSASFTIVEALNWDRIVVDWEFKTKDDIPNTELLYTNNQLIYKQDADIQTVETSTTSTNYVFEGTSIAPIIIDLTKDFYFEIEVTVKDFIANSTADYPVIGFVGLSYQKQNNLIPNVDFGVQVKLGYWNPNCFILYSADGGHLGGNTPDWSPTNFDNNQTLKMIFYKKGSVLKVLYKTLSINKIMNYSIDTSQNSLYLSMIMKNTNSPNFNASVKVIKRAIFN